MMPGRAIAINSPTRHFRAFSYQRSAHGSELSMQARSIFLSALKSAVTRPLAEMAGSSRTGPTPARRAPPCRRTPQA